MADRLPGNAGPLAVAPPTNEQRRPTHWRSNAAFITHLLDFTAPLSASLPIPLELIDL